METFSCCSSKNPLKSFNNHPQKSFLQQNICRQHHSKLFSTSQVPYQSITVSFRHIQTPNFSHICGDFKKLSLVTIKREFRKLFSGLQNEAIKALNYVYENYCRNLTFSLGNCVFLAQL